MATRELKTQDKESHSSLFKPYEKNIRHLQNIVLAAKKGVPAKAFFDVAFVSGIEKNKLAALLNVSLKSLNRYRQQHKKLSPGKSERVLKLMRLYRKGEEIFGNVNEFRKWIDEPAYGLGNMIPETLLETSGGIDLIMEELTVLNSAISLNMFVYRISLTKWSKSLIASGKVARWNSEGNNMIYTAASRALACLESVVHRSRKGGTSEFKVMIIEIPSELKIEKISFDELPENWFMYEHLETCNEIGDRWLQKKSSAVLRVPSAIIINEFNFLINPEHPDFKKIKLDRIEDFRFDPRIITN